MSRCSAAGRYRAANCRQRRWAQAALQYRCDPPSLLVQSGGIERHGGLCRNAFREFDVLCVKTPALTADQQQGADRRPTRGKGDAEQISWPHRRGLGHQPRMWNHPGEVRLSCLIELVAVVARHVQQFRATGSNHAAQAEVADGLVRDEGMETDVVASDDHERAWAVARHDHDAPVGESWSDHREQTKSSAAEVQRPGQTDADLIGQLAADSCIGERIFG